MTHTEATFGGKADFNSTCITHTRQAAQDDVIRDAAMGHGAGGCANGSIGLHVHFVLARARTRLRRSRGGGACVYAAAVLLLRVAH